MEYKVVSISPNLSRKSPPTQVADDLENVIQKYAEQGWEFMQVETLGTYVDGTNGCFGLGAKPGFHVEFQMVVFQRPAA
jgi:hypothetical protein